MASITGAARSLVDELTDFLEPKRRGAGRRKRLVLVERGDEFECYRVDRKGASLITRGRLDELDTSRLPRQLLAQPLEVRLDGSRVLSKILRLPRQASAYLDPDRAPPARPGDSVGGGSRRLRLCHGRRRARRRGSACGASCGHRPRCFGKRDGTASAAGIEADVVGTTEDPIDRPSAVNLLQGSGRARGRCAAARCKLPSSPSCSSAPA